MLIKRKVVLALVMILVFAFPAAVSAQGGVEGDEIVFAESYRLETGEILAGNLFVFGGSADIEEGGVIQGDLLQFGGSVDLAGEVEGSVVIIGGSLDLGDSAIIHGDFARVGGNVEQSSGAQVLGEEISSLNVPRSFTLPFILGSRGLDRDPLDLRGLEFLDSLNLPEFVAPRISIERSFDFGELSQGLDTFRGFNPLQELISIFLQGLAYAILAALAVLFLQRPAERVRRSIVVQPFLAGGLGLISIVLAIPILILVGITIILLPLSFFAFLAFLALGLFGWIAVGMEVGSRVSQVFGRNWHPALSAAVGVLTLFLARAALWQVPCLGFLATILVVSVGLGGVWLTRFGSREYQLSSDLPDDGSGLT